MKLFITFTIWFYYTLYKIVMCVVGLTSVVTIAFFRDTEDAFLKWNECLVGLQA